MPQKTTPPNSVKELPAAIVRQMLSLATSGFGLVAALAWNELIRTLIEEYIKTFLPQGGKLLGLFLYAAIVTTMAVIITLQLTKLQQRLSVPTKQNEQTNKLKTR